MAQLTPEQLAYSPDDLRALQVLAGQRLQVLEQQTEVAKETDRDHIVSDALTWLAADADQAEARIAQIANAIAEIDKQIEAVQGYVFAGTTVAQINTSLNNALKPQLISQLQRQKAIGQMLQELMVARDKHGDALVWLGRFVTAN